MRRGAVLIIDCQSHVFPRAYAELLTKNHGELRTKRVGRAYEIWYGNVQRFVLDPELYSVENKLRDMDAAGIDMSVLSVNMPGPERLDPELAAEGARICNDYLAEVCAQHPDRFVGLASLPLQLAEGAIEEMDRAVDELGLRGAVLYSHIAGEPVDAARFEPFYQHVEARGVPLFVHPTVPVWGEVLRDYAMVPMIGLMVDTSIAMLRLVLSGVLERCPGLQIVHPHAGGVLPYLMGRIVEQTEVKGRGREHITRSPEEIYAHVYLDLVTPSALAIRYAYDFAGHDRLLFGTDHPWVAVSTLLELVDELELSDEAKGAIFGRNACNLLNIDA
jgi:aminocarboxymuconate-semialdehyde decarboxylase